MTRPAPRTRDELEHPHAPTPPEDEERNFPIWLAIPLVVVGTYLLLVEDELQVWDVLRWGGLVVVGAAALLWRVPRVRRHPNLVLTLALTGAVAWVLGAVADLVRMIVS